MRHLKKFEAFNHRIPKTVSDAEYQEKLDTYEKEAFNEKEIEFFQK